MTATLKDQALALNQTAKVKGNIAKSFGTIADIALAEADAAVQMAQLALDQYGEGHPTVAYLIEQAKMASETSQRAQDIYRQASDAYATVVAELQALIVTIKSQQK